MTFFVSLYFLMQFIMSVPIIYLKKDKQTLINRKHPWIFSGAIVLKNNRPTDGEIVKVYDHDNNFIAIGHYQDHSSIAVRILSYKEEVIDESFWISKIKKAIDLRYMIGLPSNETNGYRLIHGEGDHLPGLVIDVYNDIIVLQPHSSGMMKNIDQISNSILHLFPTIAGVYLKTTDAQHDGAAQKNRLLFGEKSETIIKENNINFFINVETGQKTGFFLDQRVNRSILAQYSKNKTILNCFSYTGGFSLYALKNLASEVISVDISEKAMDMVQKNIDLNQITSNYHNICDNVMEYLKDTKVQYDIVVVDPPAFAKSMHKRHNAVQAYKRLNNLALKKVKPGGLLFTFSCSQVVTTQLFYDTITAAGIESGRTIRVIQTLSQGGDHPINIYHPEGHYLKGLLLFVV